MFHGFIDESGSSQSRLITLSCLAGDWSQWFYFEIDWEKALAKKNKQLKAQGRKEISRFHATYWSTSTGEFKGWSKEEREEFGSHLILIIKRYPLVVCSYSLNTTDLTEVFPEAHNRSHELAHILLLTHIMKYLANKVLGDKRWPSERIALIHDDSTYNSILREAFNHVKADESLEHKDQFTTIEPKTWRECMFLQPADFLAYENYKAVERESAGNPRRVPLRLILEAKTFAGINVKLLKPAFEDIRTKLDPESLRILFQNARIRALKPKS
jgi:hypothetical protein